MEKQNQLNSAADLLEPLVDEFEYSRLTGESVGIARKNRFLGRGCQFVKLGNLVRYRPADIRAYISQNLKPTSSMPGAVIAAASLGEDLPQVSRQ
jgi:hypothetical protein